MARADGARPAIPACAPSRPAPCGGDDAPRPHPRRGAARRIRRRDGADRVVGMVRAEAHAGWLFYAGHVTTRTRRRGFERVYDLPERVIRRASSPCPLSTSARRTGSSSSARPVRWGSRRPGRSATTSASAAGTRSLPSPISWKPEGWSRPLCRAGRRPFSMPTPARPAASRPRPSSPVRPAGLGARTRRAPLRLSLPHRDLRAGRAAPARLLRPALPPCRTPRRARRPQGRRPTRDPASSSPPYTSRRTRRPTRARRWRRNFGSWQRGSGCRRSGTAAASHRAPTGSVMSIGCAPSGRSSRGGALRTRLSASAPAASRSS